MVINDNVSSLAAHFLILISVLSQNSPVEVLVGFSTNIINQVKEILSALSIKGARGLVQPGIDTLWKGKVRCSSKLATLEKCILNFV